MPYLMDPFLPERLHSPACLAVIPGTHITFFQQTSGDEFREKNGTGIDAPPKQRPFFSNPAGDGSQKSGHSIDGKHPDRGVTYELHLSPLKGFEARPEDFQAPADKSAEDKFIFHVGSMCQEEQRYPCIYSFYCLKFV